jgi:ribokinase
MSANGPTSLGQVIVVGSANQDLTSYTPTIPKLGQTVLGSRFETSCGGKGANQAVAAAGLDIANSVHMVCRVGNDSFGQALISNFREFMISFILMIMVFVECH